MATKRSAKGAGAAARGKVRARRGKAAPAGAAGGTAKRRRARRGAPRRGQPSAAESVAVPIRRVVTGHTGERESVFVSDGPPGRVGTVAGMRGFSLTATWATDHGMTLVPGSDDPTPHMTTFVPGPGGTRFLITVFPPARRGRQAKVDAAALAAEMRAKLPGLGEAMEPDQPGMHTTDTVDYDIIMSGELRLELDNGQQAHLKPGDIVIQTGTRHAWRNPGQTPCVMYSVLVGAPRR